MKSIFDSEIRQELICRIESLTEENASLWGKMNIYQMIKHCSYWDNWMLGINKPIYKQNFIGKIFGKMALNKMTKNDSPLDKNVPTDKEFKFNSDAYDIEPEKQKWIKLINQYPEYNNPNFIHVFFGKMTKEQVGILAYKHTDHHLRQFNA